MPLTPDGFQSGVATWAQGGADPCCQPPVCYDPQKSACNLFWALPVGPMWNNQKQIAIERLRNIPPEAFTESGFLSDAWRADQSELCAGMANYSVFLSLLTAHFIDRIVWPVFRESSPFRAVTTTDKWMDRLGWQDCFRSSGRVDGTQMTPYEIEGACGPIYCPPTLPDDLQCAVDSGIVRSLARIRLGMITNLAGINWAIEPLGAKLEPVLGIDEFGEACDDEDCCGMKFTLCPVDGMIQSCASDACYEGGNPQRIPACVDQSCTKEIGQPDVIWPGVIAAECIVKSFLPELCPSMIVPCRDPRWLTCSVEAPDRPDPPPEPAFEECWDTVPSPTPTSICGVYE